MKIDEKVLKKKKGAKIKISKNDDEKFHDNNNCDVK